MLQSQTCIYLIRRTEIWYFIQYFLVATSKQRIPFGVSVYFQKKFIILEFISIKGTEIPNHERDFFENIPKYNTEYFQN